MITSAECLRRFGDPRANELNYMNLFYNGFADLTSVPRRIYCNRLLKGPLDKALSNIVRHGLQDQLLTWDGCFNIRKKTGGKVWSLHSWGLAIDINAAWNRYRKEPQMSSALVYCFTSAGFEWGGHWKRPDGMHFQLAEFPEDYK